MANTPTQDEVWANATKSEYVKFGEDEVDILFVDGKINTTTGIGNAPAYEFDVIIKEDGKDVSKMLGTQSKGLLRELSAYLPLGGKRFGISRAGEGYGITYKVREI